MAMNKRNKKQITSKQANRISLFIATAYCIFIIVRGITFKFATKQDETFYWFIICFVGTVFVYVIFYYFIFKKKYEFKN